MAGPGYKGWEGFDPATRATAPVIAQPKKTRYTAKPCILTIGGEIYEVAVAKKLNIVGIRCGSITEANHLRELVLEQKAGAISELTFQRSFALSYPAPPPAPPIVLGLYIADATYMRDGVFVVEDVKGLPGRSPLYQWKKRHFAAQYGFPITEVERSSSR